MVIGFAGAIDEIKTPLMLGALFAVILFYIFRQILDKNIFPSLTKAHSFAVIKAIIDRLFVLSLVITLIASIGYLYLRIMDHDRQGSNAEDSILSLEKDASNLQVSYEKIVNFDHDFSDVYRDNVEKNAGSLLKQVINIDDEQLRLSIRFVKYETALILGVYAAAVESDHELAKRYADDAVVYGKKALSIKGEIVGQAKSGDKGSLAVEKWIYDNNKENLVYSYLAGAYILKIKGGEEEWVDEVKGILEHKISPLYRKKHPFEEERVLKWFIDSYG